MNPSFEDTINCPIGANELNKCTHWSSYKGSPDYMNSCSSYMSVPNNWGGYQIAASGNAYCAFATYASTGPNSREFLGSMLSSQLSIGTKYFVSLKVALSVDFSLSTNCATNKIGAMFSTIPYTIFNPAPITNNPQIFSDSIITDTLNWTRIAGSFIADSSYSYIVLGNFFDDNNTDTVKLTSNMFDAAYYYLDDICVSTDSTYTSNYLYSSTVSIKEAMNEFNVFIYPNPATNFINIHFPDLNDSYELKIYNVLGREVLFKPKINTLHTILDISNIEEGVLFIKILYKNQQLNYKLIKSN